MDASIVVLGTSCFGQYVMEAAFATSFTGAESKMGKVLPP